MYINPLTHPETAWIALAVPLMLAIAAILGMSILLRGKLRVALHAYLEQRAAKHRAERVDGALLWTPPIATESQLMTICLLVALIGVVVLSRLAPLFVAIVLAGPVTALLIYLLLWWKEQQYCTKLNHALPAAVGRLAAQLRAGSGFPTALAKVVADLPEGPLKAEWTFLSEKLGAPLAGGKLATADQVVAALAVQTPSPRHMTFLGHLEVALNQTHDVLITRIEAAYRALHAAEQRQSAAATELAQMRYSGIAIGLAGIGMALYLAFTQWQRFEKAYSGPLGLIVGMVVGSVLIAPIIGGFLLARADDVDY
jgi:Flp pilus assembly protein TadB